MKLEKVGDIVNRQRLLLATGAPQLDELIIPYLDHWDIIPETVDLRRYLVETATKVKPDIMIIHDKLHSEIPEEDKKGRDDEWIALIEQLRISVPECRIVFMGIRKVTDPFLLRLINLAVYDIVIESPFDMLALVRQLKEAPSLRNVTYIKNKIPEQPDYLLEDHEVLHSPNVTEETKGNGTQNDFEEVEEYDQEEEDQSKSTKNKRREISFSLPKINIHLPSMQLGRQHEVRTEYKSFAVKVLTVTGMKGGVGKTTVALNLALAIKEHTQANVALIDFDFPYGGVAQALHIPRETSLGDWLKLPEGKIKPLGVKQRTVSFQDIDIVPMAVKLQDSLQFQKEHSDQLLEAMKLVYDVVVIDCNGLTAPALAAIERATEVIFVTEHDRVAVHNTLMYKKDLTSIYGNDFQKMSVFINKVPEDDDLTKEDIATVFEDDEEGIPVIGFAPYDDLLRQYRNEGKVIYLEMPDHKFSIGIDMLLEQLGIVPAEALKMRQKQNGSKWRLFNKR